MAPTDGIEPPETPRSERGDFTYLSKSECAANSVAVGADNLTLRYLTQYSLGAILLQHVRDVSKLVTKMVEVHADCREELPTVGARSFRLNLINPLFRLPATLRKVCHSALLAVRVAGIARLTGLLALRTYEHRNPPRLEGVSEPPEYLVLPLRVERS